MKPIMRSLCDLSMRTLLAACVMWAFAPAVSGEVVDKIIIIVNGEAVTQREVDRILAPVYEQYRAVYFGDELVKKVDEARHNVMEQLIEDRLILSEAKKLGIEAEEKEIDARIGDVMKRFPSKKEFLEGLAQQNMTMRDLRNRYKEQIVSRKLIDQKVGSSITVSPVEIEEFYKIHAGEFVQPEQIKLSNILIRPKKDFDDQAALALANDIRNSLLGGADFGEMARQYSEGPNAQEGGMMGYVQRGDLLPEIEKVVFNLNKADISEIIKTSLGYHIFKVEDKLERRAMELKEARRDIEEAIHREKVRGKLKGWVAQLKKNAYIAFK